MNWFDKRPPAPPPTSSTANKYSVDNIHQLLDEIGLMRLRVKGAQMKLLVSAVAWETQKYLDRNFTPGSPPGRIVAELQEQLAMVKNVVTTYVQLQAAGDGQGARVSQATSAVPGGTELLKNGRESLRRYIAGVTAGTGVPDITGYVVDTKILSTHFN
jgi:hypothetical protein